METTHAEVPGKIKPGTFVGTGELPGKKKPGATSGVEDEAGPGKGETWKASWVLSCRAKLHRWGTEDAFGWV